jgi:hypothetical protein
MKMKQGMHAVVREYNPPNSLRNWDAPIAGQFGPSAFTALNSLGFEIIQCDPQLSVREAVENYLSGKYKPLEEPTVSKKAGSQNKSATTLYLTYIKNYEAVNKDGNSSIRNLS